MLPYTILLVEDDEDDAVIFASLLSKIRNGAYKLKWARSAEEALDIVKREDFGACFLDYHLGGPVNGLALMNKFVAMGVEAPIIFISGKADHTVDIQAMEAGASDYLDKGQLTLPLLDRTIRYSLTQKMNEIELQRHREDLERLVAERAKDLEDAKEDAGKNSEIRAQILANMSFDIRTAMSAIGGMAEMAQKSTANPETVEYLQHLKKAASSLEPTVSAILDLSQLGTGKQNMDYKDFDLRQLLDAVFAPLAANARDKGLALSVLVQEGIPHLIRSDPGRLQHILAHLVDNAVKWTDQGGIEVEAVAEHVPENQLCFVIRDTGAGIDVGYSSSVSQNFSRVYEACDTSHRGTGLGLAIAVGLLESLEGSIWVESEPGKGSTFGFTVPFLPVEDCEALAPSALRENKPATKLRILLAEDDQLIQLYVADLLRDQGHAVGLASDGQEALDLLRQQRFDLVFMDLHMPKLSGEEAVLQIRRGQVPGVSPGIPIVALTAHAMNGDRERLLHAGLDGYIPKPFQKEDLYRALARCTASTGGKAQPPGGDHD